MNKWFVYILIVQCVLAICEQAASRILDTVKYHESCVATGMCYYAVTINDVILQPLVLGQGFQSATFGRSRHSHPSSRPSWELRHITTTCRLVNPLCIETWQFNTSRGHCTQQLGHIPRWWKHINRQCAYQARTRVCSVHWSWNVSYTQRIKSFHLKQKESTSWINMQGVGTTSHYTVNKTGYCPSTINDQLESGQPTLHCNLATQLQCYHVRGHTDNSHVINFKL